MGCHRPWTTLILHLFVCPEGRGCDVIEHFLNLPIELEIGMEIKFDMEITKKNVSKNNDGVGRGRGRDVIENLKNGPIEFEKLHGD